MWGKICGRETTAPPSTTSVNKCSRFKSAQAEQKCEFLVRLFTTQLLPQAMVGIKIFFFPFQAYEKIRNGREMILKLFYNQSQGSERLLYLHEEGRDLEDVQQQQRGREMVVWGKGLLSVSQQEVLESQRERAEEVSLAGGMSSHPVKCGVMMLSFIQLVPLSYAACSQICDISYPDFYLPRLIVNILFGQQYILS